MGRRTLPVLALALGLGLPAPVGGAPSFTVSAEVGPELDSNANRTADQAGSETVTSALLRATLAAGLKVRLGGRHLLTFDYGGGVKAFTSESARGADEGVQLGSAGWTIRLPRALLWLSASYYDAFQRVSVRDFRSGAGTLGVTLGGETPLRATFSLGYRGLDYKPLAAYSFHGVTWTGLLAWRLASGHGDTAVDWDLRAGYTAGARAFAGDVTSSPGRCQGDAAAPCTEPEPRADLHHALRAELVYQGNAELTLGYTLEANRSNSYGESFTRHAVMLKFTSHLVWGLYLSAKGTLQLSQYDDPYLVSEVSTLSFLSIDDENRSSLVAQLARDLDDRWSLLLRYGIYVNESSAHVGLGSAATSSGFLRHTLFLGVRFEYSR